MLLIPFENTRIREYENTRRYFGVSISFFYTNYRELSTNYS